MLPKIIDLFSGCGGLALGFEKMGFEIASGMEMVPEACDTISYNLSWRFGKETTHMCGDITKTNAEVFKRNIDQNGCIVIGGPPCQAYSMAGRGKLRSLGDDRINTNDYRGKLYLDFLRIVYGINARAVVMENVPESTDYGGDNIPEIVCKDLEQHGYESYWTILNSADYGVPQIRERVFVLAIKKDEKKKILLPQPTNVKNNDIVTPHQKRFDRYRNTTYFKDPNIGSENLEKWNTVSNAFSDLPSIFPSSLSKYKLLPLNIEYPYKSEPKNQFQTIMRKWYNKDTLFVSGNSFRKNTRDFPIFEKMKQGDNYVAASNIAKRLFEEEVKILGLEVDSEEYKKLWKKMIPPYPAGKFLNKWKRLEENKPSYTITAHLAKDTYSHIHPWEPRGISVREAARLQSFPDDFYFNCSMGDAFKQIGNAVPPLLALGVAKSIYNTFNEE